MLSVNCRKRLAGLLVAAMVLASLPPLGLAQSPPVGEKLRIAVLDFKLVDVDPAAGILMIDRLRSDLVNTNRFIVLDRAQSDKITEELARQQTGLTDSTTSTRIGEQFNVARIVTGRVASVKSLGIIQVNVEMIDMRTAQIAISKTIIYDGAMKGFILTKVPEIVALLTGGEAPPAAVARRNPPVAPRKIRAGADDAGEITISWRAVKDADSYNLYFSTLPGVNRGTAEKIQAVTSPFHHQALAGGTTYHYIVTAQNSAGESGDSREISTTTRPTPAVVQPEPEPEAPPVMMQHRSTWKRTLGITLGSVAAGFGVLALAVNSSAESNAQLAKEDDDAELYQQALDERETAEGFQNIGIVFGLTAVVFLVLHAFSGPDDSGSALLGPSGREEIAGFGLDVKPRSVMAGYTLRW